MQLKSYLPPSPLRILKTNPCPSSDRATTWPSSWRHVSPWIKLCPKGNALMLTIAADDDGDDAGDDRVESSSNNDTTAHGCTAAAAIGAWTR
jgi:hypothetical protein